MFERLFHRGDIRDPGEQFRRVHEEWLTRALASRREYPRIPVRRVDEGGFDALRARAHGPARARRWWSLVLERLDPIEP